MKMIIDDVNLLRKLGINFMLTIDYLLFKYTLKGYF